MCGSIKQLRGVDEPITEREIHEAALQYVRKVSGYHKPSQANRVAFDYAVEKIATATRALLVDLEVSSSK